MEPHRKDKGQQVNGAVGEDHLGIKKEIFSVLVFLGFFGFFFKKKEKKSITRTTCPEIWLESPSPEAFKTQLARLLDNLI